MDIGYTGAFLGGVLTLLGRTTLFYAGLLATLVPLGLLAGLAASLVAQNRTLLVSVAAGVVIVIGLLRIAGLEFPGFSRRAGADGNPVYGGIVLATFTLGMALPLGILSLFWTRLQLGCAAG